MSYVGHRTWWLEGPSPDSRGFGNFGFGNFGLGQTCPAGFTMDASGTCSQPSCDFPYVLSNGICVTGASILPGIPDSYVYMAGGAVGLLLVFKIMEGFGK